MTMTIVIMIVTITTTTTTIINKRLYFPQWQRRLKLDATHTSVAQP